MVNLTLPFLSESGSAVFSNNHLSEFCLFCLFLAVEDHCKNLPKSVMSRSLQLIYQELGWDTQCTPGCQIDMQSFPFSTRVKFYWRHKLDKKIKTGLGLNHKLVPSTSTLVLGNFTSESLHPRILQYSFTRQKYTWCGG